MGVDFIKIGLMLFVFFYAFGGLVKAEEIYQRCILGLASILFIMAFSIVGISSYHDISSYWVEYVAKGSVYIGMILCFLNIVADTAFQNKSN